MDVYIARQPIFNSHKRLYAYELLFRESLGEALADVEGNRATTSLLSSTFLTEGIEKIAGGKPCFVNFTEELLTEDIAAFFPKTKMVVEVLEDVAPIPVIIEACKKLSNQGYLIALDDFVYRPELDPLIDLADIIKIDFRLSSQDEIDRMIFRLSRWKVKLLAEKVETYTEFEQALKRGFTYFQGYFFSQPEVMRIREVSSMKLNLIQLLAEIHRKKTTVERMEKIISTDVGISYKLLRYINSAYYYLLHRVTSVRQAIVYLGPKEIRRFATLVAISELAFDKPEELIRLSVVRGRFCELLAGKGVDAAQLFLLGLFSLLDAILDTPMVEIMKKLPLQEDVEDALVRKSGLLFPYLQVVVGYERHEMKQCATGLRSLHVPEHGIHRLYLDAVEFADTVIRY